MGRPILIRVGASLDGSASSVLQPMVAGLKRARTQMKNEAQGSGKEITDAFGRSAKEVERAQAALVRAAGKGQKDMVEQVRASAKERVKEELAAMREIERDLAAHNRKRAQEERNAARDKQKFYAGDARRGRAVDKQHAWVERGVVAGARGALRLGVRGAVGGARALGLETSIGAHMKNSADLEKRSVDLSNAGYMGGMPGQTRNLNRIDPEELRASVRETANATGFDSNKAMEGLQQFVAKTGDLETGREVFRELAVLSKATGANLEDMVDAAGDVSNNLGDMANKGPAIQEVMRIVAGQGKLGAVEIKHLANQMSKIAAVAPQFEGSRVRNMALMGAITQSARQSGGAVSAQGAATATGSFVATLQKAARDKQFKIAGIDIMSSTEKGKFKDPQKIITEAIVKSGGDPRKLAKMVMDVQAQRAVRGFANTYRDKYNDTKGTEKEKVAAATAAVTAEFDRLVKAQILQQEITTSFAASMQTAESQTNVMNNKLAEAAEELNKGFKPALVAAAPIIIEAAKTFATTFKDVADFISGEGKKKKINDPLDIMEKVEGRRKKADKLYALGGEVDEGIPNAQRDDLKQLKLEYEKKKQEVFEGRAELRDNKDLTKNGRISDMFLTGGMSEMVRYAMDDGSDHQKQQMNEAQLKLLEGQIKAQEESSGKLLSALQTGSVIVTVKNVKDFSMPGLPTVPLPGPAKVDESARDDKK